MTENCLYKYLDVNGALSMILRRELQFTNPNYFNDPFDCHPDLFNYEVTQKYPDGWDEFYIKKAYSDANNDRRRAWVCSLTRKHDSLLMWSYYTGHKGICIGLNNNALTNHLSHSDLGWTFIPNLDVEYKDVREKPNGINGEVDTFLYQLRTKGTEWKHEQEVRHVIINPHPWISYRMARETTKDEIIPWAEVRFYPHLSSDCFNCIYLGCRISDCDKVKVLKAVKQSIPEAPVLQMIPDPENFSFTTETVDIDDFLCKHSESYRESLFSKLKRWFPFEIKIQIRQRKRDKKIRRTFSL